MGKLGSKVVVKQDDEAPIERVVLAKAIVDMSAAVERLRRSGLNDRAIIVLVSDKTKIAKGTIEDVLDGLASLSATYTNLR